MLMGDGGKRLNLGDAGTPNTSPTGSLPGCLDIQSVLSGSGNYSYCYVVWGVVGILAYSVIKSMRS